MSLWIATNAVMAAEIEEVRPADMDLIEFLGGWESEDGEWLDPALFDAIFSEDVSVIEGESVLREQEIEKKGDPLLADEPQNKIPDERKEEK